MPIILGRILFRVITRRQNRHLMPVNGIVIEEMPSLLINLPGAVLVTPEMQQLLVHRPGSRLCDFAQVSECREFGVGNTHVCFIGLDVGGGDRLEFGGWGGVEEFVKDGDFEVVAGPGDEFFEVDFAYGANGVELKG